jgi:hypothetical protein
MTLKRSNLANRCGSWRRPVRRMASIIGASMLLGANVPAVSAGILDAESCRRHKSEYDALANSGIRDVMTKGPEWAKTNLTKERMEQVRRYLALEEDVRFRCPLGKARPELEAAESEAGASTPLNADETAPAAKAPPQPKSKPTQKSKPASAQQAAKTQPPVPQPVDTAAEPPRKSPR